MTPALCRSLASLFVLLLCLSAPVLGQQAARSTLTGTVTDPVGAVVSGARVTATLATVGIRRETTTNDEGLYIFTDLAPGEYELRVDAQGFAAYVITQISLKVGQSVTINVPLEIGATHVTLDEDFGG